MVDASSSSLFGGLTFEFMCDCGLRVVLLALRTKKNPRRKFMRCLKYRSKIERCDYFEWVHYDNYEKKECLLK